MKHVKVEFCWSEGTLQEREGGAFRKTWKTKCLIAAALYNRLGEKEQIVSRLLQKIQQSYCSPSCWIKAMPGWTLLQTLEDVWLWDFRVFQKYMKCRKTSLLCQNTSAFCLHYIFPFCMLKIIRPLTALIRLNEGEGKWEAAQSILSWNLLSHLSLKCKYGLGPALPSRGLWLRAVGMEVISLLGAVAAFHRLNKDTKYH